ncbi:MAG: type 1 glutamine amidotransferase [Bacteroidetes bacterium]|nr:MAG: type 1 glutamine amidotransferase [Bacteroidota bacterium]
MTPPARRKPFEAVRVLLVQARDTADIEHQEQLCFLERCRLRPEQLAAVNVTRDRLHPGLLDGFDALMIGGAGEYSITEDYPFTEPLLDLIRAACDGALPTFGSCWGHQAIARAFGGTVIKDRDRAEFGSRWVELTPAGRTDPLFGDFPPRFLANMGHHDRVAVLPKDAVELAFNDSQPNQAFRLKHRPVYGTQFHSELDAHRERERLLRYRDLYRQELGSDDAFEAILASLAETTEVDHLLYDFLVKFVVQARPVID